MSSVPAIADPTILDAVAQMSGFRLDGWENIITQIGTSSDKRSGGRVKRPVLNVNYRMYEDLYFGDDLAATIAELPAREMVREWFDVLADDPALDDPSGSRTASGDDATTEEKVTIGKRVTQELETLDAQEMVFEALVWARVFGGSLLFLGVDDGGGDDPESLAQPLNEDRIESFDHMMVFDRWDVNIHSRTVDPKDKNFGRPELYQINTTTLDGQSALPGDRIHHSRFIRFDGTLVNRRRARENGGWADSIYTRIEELIRDYNLAWGSIANILQDFAQAIFKMRGLRDAILSDKDDIVLRRMAIIDKFRSSSRAVPLDAEQEDFDRKQTPVAGLSDLMDRFALRLSAGARLPATLLFGQSPAGMQATGASDIRFFYDLIAGLQNSMLRPKLERIVRLIFKNKQGPTNGVEPDDWSLKFRTLYQLTEKEKAEVRNIQSKTDTSYVDTGVVTEDEVAFSRFGGGEYSPETILDLEQRQEDELAEEREPDPPMPPAPVLDANGNPVLPTPPVPPVPVVQNTDRADTIERRGGKFLVLSGAGKVLGAHATEPEALKQLGAIEAQRGRADLRDDMEVVALVFDRGHFTPEQAIAWATRNGFKAPAINVDELPEVIKIRQVQPAKFQATSFRTLPSFEGGPSFLGVLGLSALVGRRK